jgi:hypothetical protein
MADKVIFLKAGTTSWTVPSDWSAVNSIECIGAGAGGSAGTTFNGGQTGAGGASGAYSKTTNLAGLSAGASVVVGIGAKGGGGTFNGAASATAARGTAGGDTYFNATSLANAVTNGSSVSVAAEGAKQGANSYTTGAAGLATNSVGGTTRDGSAGGSTPVNLAQGNGSGAGAPGPTGVGGTGTFAPFSSGWGSGGGGADGGANGNAGNASTAGAGGARSGGSGGSGGAANTAGAAGVAGTGGGGGGNTTGNGGAGSAFVLWTATEAPYAAETASPGSGGGSAGVYVAAGGAAGGYGAGGGGGYGSGGGKAGGDGSDGLIVITYTPAAASAGYWVGGGSMALAMGMGLNRGRRWVSGTPAASSAVTHNGTTPATVAADATDHDTLITKLNAAGSGPATIALRGPAGGSAALAYQTGVDKKLDLSGYTFSSPVTIRAANYADKPVLRLDLAVARQINACANLIFDGIEFDITYASDSPLASIFYDPSSLTLNRCYIHGSVLGSVLTAPYYGTTTAVRLCDVRSGSNVTVTNCVIDKIQCGLYMAGRGLRLHVRE